MTIAHDLNRREFVAASIAITGVATTSCLREKQSGKKNVLPTVLFGEHRISRLIVGGNPVSGNSHVSRELDKEMLNYFSAAKIKKMLIQCEANGINTWQSRGDKHIRRLLHEYRNDGGTIQWIAQTASEFASFERNAKDIARMKPIGIYHHGSRTDKYWHNDKIDNIKDDLKVLRDLGVVVGVASHEWKCLTHIEEHDWDVDFYMACFYNPTKRIAGDEAYLSEDRQAMCRFIKQTDKQCIAFKILAAGRNTKTSEDLINAFRFAFANIKENDIVNVGMFPKYKDQVAENSNIVRDILAV